MRVQIVLLALACVTGISADVPLPNDDLLGQLADALVTFLKSYPFTLEEKEAVDDLEEAVVDQADAMANQKRVLEDGVEMARAEVEEAEDEDQLKRDEAENDVLVIKQEMDEFYKDTQKGEGEDSSQ